MSRTSQLGCPSLKLLPKRGYQKVRSTPWPIRAGCQVHAALGNGSSFIEAFSRNGFAVAKEVSPCVRQGPAAAMPEPKGTSCRTSPTGSLCSLKDLLAALGSASLPPLTRSFAAELQQALIEALEEVGDER